MDPNEETLAFYFAVGHAITQWAHVESAMLAITLVCFGHKEASLHTTAFFAVENFRSKLQLTDSVLTQKFWGTDRYSDWPALMERAKTEAKARNKLAHYWVFNDDKNEPGRRKMLLPRRLAAPSKQHKRPKKRPNAIYLRDIVGFRLRFFALMCALENFQRHLLGLPEHFPKSLEQPKSPPSIAALRREIYAYAQHPPKPSRA